DNPLSGWLQLAILSQQHRQSATLLTALKQWQLSFAHHPANHLIAQRVDLPANKMLSSPKKIAVLVPLSGVFSGPGHAILEGFMAGYKRDSAQNTIEIKVYDTSKGVITSLYEQAISDGAHYVVGPLLKNQVAIVAALPHLVPTLLLNDSVSSAQENAYLFGLSPLHEASEVAIKARSSGYAKALIIAPQNEWGMEVSQAFSQQWHKKGGQVIDRLTYSGTDDLNKKMRAFLHINNSEQREKQLKELLGQKILVGTSRRQDFDVIFLIAYPSKARQIMPLLNYYYAGDIPVYATSSIYSGSTNALKDNDLNGVIFCDIPWVFSHQMGSKSWPEQFNSYNRLYALGNDSYALANQLNRLIVFPADGLPDLNGILYLKSSQHIARVLEWGQFKQGLVHSLG
ncbi:MAG: penicillin-binding protein activator, partial [bacterium]|nr:penicillin-binding protein activator [bacterium]